MNNTQPNKYQEALAKYHTSLIDSTVSKEVAHLLDQHLAASDTPDVKRLLLSCLDLTTLRIEDSDESVMQLVKQVNRFDEEHPDMPGVAAICVYPNFAEIVRATLEVDRVRIACVTGGFPSGQTFAEVKVAETALALVAGADEIDTVFSVGKYFSGDYEALCDEIQELKETCKDHPLKVILETGALGSMEHVKRAAILAMYAGADFIKTSTGKLAVGTTPEAAYVMCQAIREYHQQTGTRIGFKAAGGISSVRDALIYYTIVREVLGPEWLNPGLFRIGASRLANLLLSDIWGKEVKYF